MRQWAHNTSRLNGYTWNLFLIHKPVRKSSPFFRTSISRHHTVMVIGIYLLCQPILPVMQRLIHCEVPIQDTSRGMEIGSVVPDFTGKSKKELLPLMERTDIRLNINGSGWVTSQSPEPGTPVTENMVIELNLE